MNLNFKDVLLCFVSIILISSFSNAQIISNQAFIKGNFVEIGVNQYGVYGTSIYAPTDYHPRLTTSAKNLGFVADPDKDGWTIGSPNYYGDFFYPGTPQEGFSVQFNGNTYNNWNSGTFTIPGTNTSIISDATGQTAIWEGIKDGLSITQKTFAPIDEAFFVIRIELTNTTSAVMNGVYYMRTLDPDNDVTLSSNYNTLNEIVYDLPNPENNTLVSAKGTVYTDSYLGLGTRDCRANSFILDWSLTPDSNANVSQYHDETTSDIYSGQYTDDVGIGITFNIGDIEPGETKRFAYTYILNQDDLSIALSQTLPEVLASSSITSPTAIVDGNSYSFCESESLTLSVDNGEDYVWHWEPEEYFSAPYGDDVILTVPNETTTFTLTGNSDCDPITYSFTISPSTFEADLTEQTHVICDGGSTNHNPMEDVSTPTSTINWYDAPSGGTLLSSSPDFSTGVLNNPTSTPVDYIYYFEETTTSGCISPRIPFKVKVYNSLEIPSSILKECRFGTTTANFNLLDYQNFVEPIDNATITYYASQNDYDNNNPIINPENYTNTTNPQTIYVEIEVNSSCSDVTELTLEVFPQIDVNTASLVGCDDDFDGTVVFDLTEANSQINSNPDTEYSYYLTLSNAENNINEIVDFNNHTNITNPQTIYVRAYNDNCYNFSEILLEVFDKPILTNGSLDNCEENLDGTANFNLTDATLQFSSDTTNTYNFATSIDNLENGIYITDPTNFTNTSNPQTLYVEGFNTNNCSNVVTLTLNVLPVNRYTISDFNWCDDDYDGYTLFDLTDKNSEMDTVLPTGTYNYTYYISELDALNAQNSIPSNYTNSTTPSETIYVRAENTTGGCPSIISFNLVVLVKPYVDLPTNFGLCLGTEITLDAGAGFDTYLWSTSETSQSIVIDEPGNYTLEVSNIYGSFSCSTTHNFSVIASDQALITSIEVVDFTYYNNSITVLYSGIGDYEFSIDGDNYQDSPIFENLESDIYTVYVRDKNGCGIVNQDVTILMYPNFFTPNGDGYNDYWNIKYSTISEPELIVNIFDRYGKLIKTISGAGKGWDGTMNGKLLPSSDYWFVVTRKDGRTFKGHFTLKR